MPRPTIQTGRVNVRSNPVPGTTREYQAGSEEINRSLGLITPPMRVFDPVQRELPKLFPVRVGARR